MNVFHRFFRPTARTASLLVACVAMTSSMTVHAQLVRSVPVASSDWVVQGDGVDQVSYLGREAFRISGGSVTLKDAAFRTGTIEFDVAFGSARNFLGVFWGELDPENRQVFYMRPHMSGNVDANQYNPDIGGVAGWQLYHGPNYGAPVAYRFNEWQHVRVVVGETTGEVYIDSEEPVFAFNVKGPTYEGNIGLYAGRRGTGHFSNFTFQPGTPTLRSQPETFDAPEPGTVLSWDVSDSFDEALLGQTLSGPILDARSWRAVAAEEKGITNLAHMDNTANTVLARTTFTSGQDAVRMFSFGYSDRVQVYLNGERIYLGDNGYQTRDYRYLGTIGLFETLPLHVREGRNELVLAVSESFGGWGVMGRFVD